MNLLRKFLQRSAGEKRLLFEALYWLGISRLATLLIPFRWVAPHLGEAMAQTPEMVMNEPVELLQQIQWAMQAAARRAPWRCLCLEQAIAAKSMLQRRGLASTLYLGVTRDQHSEFKAHAWLRYGKVILTGKQGMEHFTVVSTFAENKATDEQNGD